MPGLAGTTWHKLNLINGRKSGQGKFGTGDPAYAVKNGIVYLSGRRTRLSLVRAREARRAAIPFPGLAPATDISLGSAARTAVLRSLRPAGIRLIAARRPADGLAVTGWKPPTTTCRGLRTGCGASRSAVVGAAECQMPCQARMGNPCADPLQRLCASQPHGIGDRAHCRLFGAIPAWRH